MQRESEWALTQELPTKQKLVLLTLAILNDGCVLNVFNVAQISALTDETKISTRRILQCLEFKGLIRLHWTGLESGTYEFNNSAYLSRQPSEGLL